MCGRPFYSDRDLAALGSLPGQVSLNAVLDATDAISLLAALEVTSAMRIR